MRTNSTSPVLRVALEHGGGGRGQAHAGLRLVHVTAIDGATRSAFADVHLHVRCGRVVGVRSALARNSDLLVDVVLGRVAPVRGRVLLDGRTPVPAAHGLPDRRVVHLVQLEPDPVHAIATTVGDGASVLVLDVVGLEHDASEARVFVTELRRLADALDVAVLLRCDEAAALQACDEAWSIGRTLRRHRAEHVAAARATPATVTIA